MLGICLVLFWDIFGICLGYFWDIVGKTLGYFLDSFGICFGYVLDIFGICWGYFWDMFDIFWTYFGNIFYIFLNNRKNRINLKNHKNRKKYQKSQKLQKYRKSQKSRSLGEVLPFPAVSTLLQGECAFCNDDAFVRSPDSIARMKANDTASLWSIDSAVLSRHWRLMYLLALWMAAFNIPSSSKAASVRPPRASSNLASTSVV